MSESIDNISSNNCISVSSGFDPQAQPVLALPPDELLTPDSVSLGFIRRAFSQSFDWQVEPLFSRSFSSALHDTSLFTPAAVFIPLVERNNTLHVLFTRRALHLSDHAGEISFPGGRVESSDKDDIAAAVRETHEEIGVSPEYIQLIGTQPGFITTSRFIMRPVVGLLKPGFTINPDASEVAEVFEVPLPALMDPRQHRLHLLPQRIGLEKYYFSMQWQSHFIWGATAALIRNLYRFLVAAQNASGSVNLKTD